MKQIPTLGLANRLRGSARNLFERSRSVSGHVFHVDVQSNTDAWFSVISALPNVSMIRLLYVAFIKRVLDIAAAALLVLILSPLLFVTAVLVCFDTPGSPIFSQQRVGRGGKPFRLYKFRTMNYDATGKVQWRVDDRGRINHKIRDDPRVTRVGRVLRRTSLDELPQLVNIIKGDMSLIGPRPELPEIVACYSSWQHARHLVRPGLTGWWQVSGRSDLPMHENTELDLFYVRRLSFTMDVKIALKTVHVVLRGLGAF